VLQGRARLPQHLPRARPQQGDEDRGEGGHHVYERERQHHPAGDDRADEQPRHEGLARASEGAHQCPERDNENGPPGQGPRWRAANANEEGQGQEQDREGEEQGEHGGLRHQANRGEAAGQELGVQRSQRQGRPRPRQLDDHSRQQHQPGEAGADDDRAAHIAAQHPAREHGVQGGQTIGKRLAKVPLDAAPEHPGHQAEHHDQEHDQRALHVHDAEQPGAGLEAGHEVVRRFMVPAHQSRGDEEHHQPYAHGHAAGHGHLAFAATHHEAIGRVGPARGNHEENEDRPEDVVVACPGEDLECLVVCLCFHQHTADGARLNVHLDASGHAGQLVQLAQPGHGPDGPGGTLVRLGRDQLEPGDDLLGESRLQGCLGQLQCAQLVQILLIWRSTGDPPEAEGLAGEGVSTARKASRRERFTSTTITRRGGQNSSAQRACSPG